MKKFAYSASTMLAAVVLASAAQAADVSAPASYDWTGFYLGANAGVAWNNSSLDNDIYYNGDRVRELENRIDGDQAAFTAGGILGYNYQIDNIVLGAEADINYLGFGDSRSRNFDGTINSIDVTGTTKTSLDVDWFGTLRGRLGFAIDNFLVYGTGGLAYGHVSADGKLSIDDGFETVTWKGSTDSTNWGWTVGAGAEYGFDKWSVGVEYLYVDLGDGNWKDNSDPLIRARKDTIDLKGSSDFAFSTVRATVKYHF